jgi:hypothetical protein
MAQDEMNTITEDRWDAEIWGTGHEDEQSHENPELIFYFGQNVRKLAMVIRMQG